jgi:hypothetical protein
MYIEDFLETRVDDSERTGHDGSGEIDLARVGVTPPTILSDGGRGMGLFG